jgi:hypothetical protein
MEQAKILEKHLVSIQEEITEMKKSYHDLYQVLQGKIDQMKQ